MHFRFSPSLSARRRVWLLALLVPALAWAQSTEPASPVELPPAVVVPPAAPVAPEHPAAASVPPPEPQATVATPANEVPTVATAPAATETASAPELKGPAPEARPQKEKGRRRDNAQVNIGSNASVAAGDVASAVVSILGSSTSAGTVEGGVVSVLGSSTSSGSVGDAVVSVLGSTRITGGSVRRAAVAVLGDVYVNGHVREDVVSVLGNVELGPQAIVDGEVVCIGGQVRRDPQAVVHGEVQNVGVGPNGLSFAWLTAWLQECVRYARPLAIGPNLLWAWCVALTFLGVYTLIALIAPGTVKKCVETLEQRPGKSILAGVLVMVLTPVAYVLLALTLLIVVGVALIPLFSLGLFFAGLFGKVVMLAFLGRRIMKVGGGGGAPALWVLLGGAVVLALYTVPVLGLITYKLLGLLGLGVVIYTLLLSIRSNRSPVPGRPVSGPAPVGAAPTAAPVAPVSTDSIPLVFPAEGVAGAAAPGFTPPVAPAAILPPVISAATLPRAGFWLRLAAALLDVVLVAIAFGFLHSVLKYVGGFPLWFAAYNVAMWATKGTTIGGIICGLKVVRLDDRPLDWGMAVVRGLGAFLSLAVAGLGFIWVAFDDDRQSWHDKIAGTTIVVVPKGTSLV